MIPPIQETVASEDPEIAPKNIEASETTAPRPPIIHPTKDAATSTRRLASPPTLITTPERIKNGIAIIVRESTPVTEYDATMDRSNFVKNCIMIIVAPPSAKPTGTPNIISAINTTNKTKAIIYLYLLPPSQAF